MLHKYFIIPLIVALMLAACGTAAPAATSTPVSSPTSIPTLVPPTETTLPTATQTPDPSFSVTDAYGNTVDFPNVPERIISLAPSTTELLYAVGAGSQVIGRDSYSDYPPEAAQVTDIGGGLGDLNTEAILVLKPDLVMAAELTSADQVKTMQDLGLTVFVVPNPSTFDDLYADMRLVGQITGHSEDAETLITSDQARVSAVEDKISGVTEKPLVFYELDATDPSAPWTAGKGTFVDTLINMAGGRNVGASLSGDWAQISTENLLVQDPDLILLGDSTWGGITPEMVAARPGWGSLKAVKNGNVYPFDDNTVSRPGPRLVDGLEAMAKLIHPELFK